MKDRRALIDGIKPGAIDATLEKEFVHGAKAETAKAPAPKVTDLRDQNSQPPISRVPLTTRIRPDFGGALKRESLERQLKGQFPNSLQEILEEALEPWMRDKGYIQ